MTKAYVDANVILRFFLNDDLDKAAEVATLFESVANGEILLVVDEMIVADMVWVLKSFYKQSIEQISFGIREFLLQDGIEVPDKNLVLQALALFETKNVDFSDALLAVRMQKQGVAHVFSYDKHFDRLPGIERLLPGKYRTLLK